MVLLVPIWHYHVLQILLNTPVNKLLFCQIFTYTEKPKKELLTVGYLKSKLTGSTLGTGES